jgi:hypothetical protein
MDIRVALEMLREAQIVKDLSQKREEKSYCVSMWTSKDYIPSEEL